MEGTCIFLSLVNMYISYANMFETNVKISNRIQGLGFVLLITDLLQLPVTVEARWTATLSGGRRNALPEKAARRHSVNPASCRVSRAPSCGFPFPEHTLFLKISIRQHKFLKNVVSPWL